MKTAFISGGHGDIGKAIAKRLKGKYKVLSPGRGELDVTNRVEVFQYMEKYQPDIIINNAGYIDPQPISQMTPYSYNLHFDVNFFGAVHCIQAGICNYCETFINIGSSAAYKGKKNWSSYCSSKAALMSLTESMIEEGYDAYCLNIGRTKTKMRYRLCGKEDDNTLLMPDDIAKLVKDICDGHIQPRVIKFDKKDGIN